MNNELGALRDEDSHHFNSVLRALAYASDDAGTLSIREWAAAQQDTDVRRLINRFPDVITVFKKLHTICAFRGESVEPKALLDIKRVGWGVSLGYLFSSECADTVQVYAPCIKGLQLILRYLASPLPIPLEEGEIVESATIPKIHQRLSALFLRDPDFAFSSVIRDILVDGFDTLFVEHLEKYMPYFAAGVSKTKGDSVIWANAFEAYAKEMISTLDVWTMREGINHPKTVVSAEDDAIMALVKDKLLLIWKFPSVVAGYPMLPDISTTTFPFLCPKLLHTVSSCRGATPQ
jgi:hypothetical protein